jgi:hypothetical protein
MSKKVGKLVRFKQKEQKQASFPYLLISETQFWGPNLRRGCCDSDCMVIGLSLYCKYYFKRQLNINKKYLQIYIQYTYIVGKYKIYLYEL